MKTNKSFLKWWNRIREVFFMPVDDNYTHWLSYQKGRRDQREYSRKKKLECCVNCFYDGKCPFPDQPKNCNDFSPRKAIK